MIKKTEMVNTGYGRQVINTDNKYFDYIYL